jgi:tripartite-type tricarboxylate transporter receptor subunit TctC
MTISRRDVLAGLGTGVGAGLGLTLLPRRALAAFPERPIHLIVPFAAGGNADIVGRIAAQLISEKLKQPVVVENRAGAGGGIGADQVARAAPDGYTLLVASNGPMTVNPFIQAHLGYDPLKDFAAIALTSYVPHALLLSNKVEAKSVADLVALSKQAPVTIATSGVGSATHMTLERLKAATGANITHVPYRGGGALLPDVIGGSVQGALTEFSTALPLHKAGQARILAIAAAHRSTLAPDIATFDEGGVKGFTAESYIGLVAPAKTPPDIVASLQQAVDQGLAGGKAVDTLVGLGSEIATPQQRTSQGFADFLRADYERMRDAAKLAGITPQ